MRLSMNKEDICEPVEVPKENWSEVLSTVIKSSIEGADRIGDNLKKQCIDYFEQLETNRDKAIEILKLCNSKCSKETISILERGKE